ncbi:cilia- and flagella-associated protein 418-like isoform X2 [Tachypleus tridentatus]
MADDIDQLLDEVESKYLENVETRKQKCSAVERKKNRAPNGLNVDLEEAIDDICELPNPEGEIPDKRLQTLQTTSTGPTSRRDCQYYCQLNSQEPHLKAYKSCLTAYLGGTAVSTGLSSSLTQRACSNLRCLSCDFNVTMFDNYCWDQSTDYLFLRNNMPDFQRVKKKLSHKPGWRSYACQCQHRSVRDLAEVRKCEDLKWVCGKH